MSFSQTSNQTSTVSSTTLSLTEIIVPQIGYIILGSIGFILSGVISLSLLIKSVELRQGQRHILLTTMELANFGLNLTYFLAGCFRLNYVLTGRYVLYASAWQCMLRIYSPLFIFTFQFVPLTLLANACERFLAVCYPTFYYHHVKTKHQVFVSLLMVAYCSFGLVTATIISYNSDQDATYPYTCLTNNAVGKGYTSYFYTESFICTITSAPVSLATVLALIKKRKVGDTVRGNAIPSSYMGKQKALTKAMVLATVVVFLLMCPPTISNFITSALHITSVQGIELLLPYNAVIIMSHSIVNDIILFSMNRQVRSSVKKLFRTVGLGSKKNQVTQITVTNQSHSTRHA